MGRVIRQSRFEGGVKILQRLSQKLTIQVGIDFSGSDALVS